MDRKLSYLLVAICLAGLLSAEDCMAQRTSRGSFLLDARGSISALDFPGPGADLSFGQYLQNSYWKSGIGADLHSHALSEDYTLDYMDLVAEGAWLYRLAGTRNRVFSLYAGAGIFLGYEMFDPGKKLPGFILEKTGNGSFLYGLYPAIEMEIYLCRWIALSAFAEVPINFSSPVTWYHVNCGLGVRFAL